MKRGRTEAETCALNGWAVGTVLRGHEVWANGKGTWTTMRITAIGETQVLGICFRHEETLNGEVVGEQDCDHRHEHMWTLQQRDWVAETEEPMTVEVGMDERAVAG